MRSRVEPVDIAQQKHTLPRHHHIIEKDDAIHLLKARTERLVEMRAALVKAVAAQKFEPRCTARDRKAQRERAVAFGMAAHARRVNADLVGKRPQCRQDARAAHDDTGIGLAHDFECRALLQVEDAGGGAAALQIDQRMGQGQVVFPDIFVIAQHVLAEFRAPLRKELGGTGPGGIGHVHEIGRTAHHAASGTRPIQHHLAAALEIFAGARDDKGEPDPLARGG